MASFQSLGASQDIKYVTVTVPKGKKSGESMRYTLPETKTSIAVVIPGPSLKEGDTFQYPDPEHFVTVNQFAAPNGNAYCWDNMKYCGAYDDVNCCTEPVSNLRRWICVASSPFCCVGMLLIYLLAGVAMALGITSIIDGGGEWPSFSIQGDLDPNSIYTLQGWAFDDFRDQAAQSLLDEEELLDIVGEVEEDQVGQTQANGGWSLLMIFRTRGELGEPDRNLLTPDRLKFIRQVEREITTASAMSLPPNPQPEYPAYEDVCLKVAKNSSFFNPVPITNETELECYTPFTPLQYYYPSVQTSGIHSMYNHEFYDTDGFAPGIEAALRAAFAAVPAGEPQDTNIDLIATLAARPVTTAPNTLVFNGKGDQVSPCRLNTSLREAHVSEQIVNFTCIFNPLSAPFVLAQDPSIQASLGGMIFNPSTTAEDINGLMHPALENIENGAPFCSMCYSSSCTCSRDSSTPQEAIDETSALMADVPFLSFMFDSDFGPDNLESAVMLYSMSFGGPLDGFSTVSEGENTTFFGPPGEQTTVFNKYASQVFPILDEHGYFADSEIEVVYFWSVALADITLNLLIHDMVLVVGSISFIFIYMWIHTRSVCLTIMGLAHILASFPLAFFGYYYIFGIEPFYTLNFLSVYVILAIGADDVFVMTDAWAQFGHLPPAKRMVKAFSRASKAMLITSLTTAGAFFATAASPLLDVSTFGLYTALLVISNYVSVITYFVAVICFYHFYMEYACCCFPRCNTAIPERRCCECLCNDRQRQLKMRLEDQVYARDAHSALHGDSPSQDDSELKIAQPVDPPTEGADSSPVSPEDIKAEEADVQQASVAAPKPTVRKLSEVEPQLPALETFCGKHFYCVIATGYNRYIFPVLLLGLTIGMAYCASQLGPTTTAEAFLPSWHPVQRFIDVYNTDFGITAEQDMKKVSLIFGLQPNDPMDRSEFGRFDLSMGPLNFYETTNSESCDFSTPAAQSALYDICTEFAFDTPVGTNADGSPEPLLRQDSGLGELEVNCWLLGFKPWFETTYNNTFPCTMDNCTEIMVEYVEQHQSSLSNEEYDDKLYVTNDGKLIGTTLQFNSSLGYFQAVYAATHNAFTAWDDYVTTTFADHDVECLRSAMHVAEDRDKAWVFLNTQELLILGAFTGTGSSLAVALGVLWLSTGNIIVALLATLNMICVTVCILGFMFLFGWELGTIESVSATVLVGLSVDYVVHIAQAYVECEKVTRAERVRSALFEMGNTVLGGAITSLGASGFLFGCWLQYFFKFGGFMFLTIGLSFLFCFFFFLPIMLFAGPERSVEIDGMLYDPASFGCCCRCGGVPASRRQAEKSADKTDASELELAEMGKGSNEAAPEGTAVERSTVTA